MELINKYAKEIVGKLGDKLEALILVGSFSRGEGVEGASDIEFWAVVKDLSAVKKLDFNSNVSLGFTTRKHLTRLKPYIYTVEVKKFGKVLYGDSNILNLIPDYSYEDIKPFDGFILLNNRIVEQLILLNKIKNGQEVNQYEFDKGYIQLVNSLLALNKNYRSLYLEKLEKFRKISKDSYSGLLNKAEEAFVSINHRQAEIACLTAVRLPSPQTLKKWLELRDHFKKVWLEEEKTLSRANCWIKMLSSGRPMRFFVYRSAARLYFSEGYQDKNKRDRLIKKWERYVK